MAERPRNHLFEDPDRQTGRGPRVLLVTNVHPLPRQPTLGTFVAEQAASLRARGDLGSVDVFVIDGLSARLNYSRAPTMLRAAVRRLQPDLIHAHHGLSGAVVLAARIGLPLLVTYHGSEVMFHRGQRAISRRVARRADANICVAAAQQPLLGAPSEVIGCGIDVERFSGLDRSAARARHRVPDGALALLFPGQRWRPVKGHPRFEAVFERLAATGQRPHELRLEEIERTAVPSLFAAADVMVMTSLSEGAPVSIMEALASGLPVLAPPVGAVAAMLEGIDCARVEPFDPDRYAAAVLELAAVGAPRVRPANPAAARHDLAKIADRVAAIYHRLALA